MKKRNLTEISIFLAAGQDGYQAGYQILAEYFAAETVKYYNGSI